MERKRECNIAKELDNIVNMYKIWRVFREK